MYVFSLNLGMQNVGPQHVTTGHTFTEYMKEFDKRTKCLPLLSFGWDKVAQPGQHILQIMI